MARRKDHNRDELKTLICDAAWAIIATDGVGALTARRIAGDIGYAAGSIYNVFPSMDDLLLHVNARTLDMLLAVLGDGDMGATTADNLDQSLQAMARRYVAFAHDYRPFWMALFTERGRVIGDGDEWYHAKVSSLFGPLKQILRQSFPDLAEDACDRHARIMWSSGHGLTFLAVTGKLPACQTRDDLIAYLDQFIATYIRGIKVP